MNENNTPTPTEIHRQMTIDASRFQARKFLSALEDYEGLQQTCRHGQDITPNYLPLLSDTFSAFFQTQARLKQQIPENMEENRALMNTVLGLREYKELHSVSKFDFFASAAATRAFSEKLTELIKEKKTKDNQRNNQNNNQKNTQGNQEENNDGKGGALGLDEDTLRWAARAALKKGLEEAQETKQAVECFGREKGGLQNIPIAEQFRLADLLAQNMKLKEIVRLLGRMKLEALSAKRTQVTSAPPLRRGVETAGIEGLERALPEELLDLALGDKGESRFYRKLAEEEILVHGYKTPKAETKGPILVAVDSSGSMQGEREIWARALALACFVQAKQGKRKARGLIFGAAGEIAEVEIHETEKLAQLSFHGGTDYIAPLEWAREQIARNPKADLLFITDGICQLPPEAIKLFIEAKECSGARCLSVLIGSQATETVKQFSDKVLRLSGNPTAKDGGQILTEF